MKQQITLEQASLATLSLLTDDSWYFAKKFAKEILDDHGMTQDWGLAFCDEDTMLTEICALSLFLNYVDSISYFPDNITQRIGEIISKFTETDGGSSFKKRYTQYLITIENNNGNLRGILAERYVMATFLSVFVTSDLDKLLSTLSDDKKIIVIELIKSKYLLLEAQLLEQGWHDILKQCEISDIDR